MSDGATDVAANFSDYKPPLNDDGALVEANRCLMCYDAPCIRACPTKIDIPGFIKKIASGNMRGSARMILEANILGASCARVCPTEELCEGACVMHDVDEKPIDIGRLQRYATDPLVFDGDERPLFEAGPSNGKRVALVGAGPASLGCAAELVQRGYEAVCFEKADEPGGLNTFGIADYKMTAETALKEIEWVQQLGLEIRYNQEVGRDVVVDELYDQFDAVFIGVGLGGVDPIGLEGEHLDGVRDSLEFIAQLKTTPKEEVALRGKTVAVIGGGNTAIDAVTQSSRLGAERVYMVYRRGPEAMGAYAHEQELARKDGGIFVYHSQPVKVLGDDGQVTGLECVRTETRHGSLEYIEGSEYVLDCDLVLRATGQSKLVSLLEQFEGLALEDWGTVIADEEGRTSLEQVWAGGDCVSGGQEVVNAVAEGKRAAQSIHETLTDGEG